MEAAESLFKCLEQVPDPRKARLTGVCQNEIVATDRPRHPRIPAYAGMMEWV